MSLGRLFGRGKEAEDSSLEAKKNEMDFLLAKRELELETSRQPLLSSGGMVTTSSNIVNVSGQVVWATASGDSFTSNRIWTTTSGSIVDLSGNTVMLQDGVYRRSDDPLISLPNIWCKECYRGCLESLHHGYVQTYNDKIWAKCFECWRKEHERN